MIVFQIASINNISLIFFIHQNLCFDDKTILQCEGQQMFRYAHMKYETRQVDYLKVISMNAPQKNMEKRNKCDCFNGVSFNVHQIKLFVSVCVAKFIVVFFPEHCFVVCVFATRAFALEQCHQSIYVLCETLSYQFLRLSSCLCRSLLLFLFILI